MDYFSVLFFRYLIGGGGSGDERYDGPYDVIPNFNLQTLLTKNKFMSQHVRVEKIPVYKADNLSGGYTVVIGGNN